VQAQAQFVPSQSDPERKLHLYAYRITLTNFGPERARLVSRHWVIVDAEGNRENVHGPGVVGEFPDLGPGESFSYVSSCPLRTRWGTMEGTYLFERPGGDRFVVQIGRFFLVPSAPPLQPQGA
jgi:ApaG protein